MYGQFKSVSRASRRGHIAVFQGLLNTFYLRKVKSQKGGKISKNGELILNRYFKGATWLSGAIVTNNQKLTKL